MLAPMSELRTVGIVGLGRMGRTLAAAFSRAVGPGCLSASGRSASSIERLEQVAPGAQIASVRALPDSAQLIVLCTPQAALPAVLADLRPRLTADHVVVTIGNRQPLAALAEAVPGPVAKLIPSAGNEIGAGATLLTPGPGMPGAMIENLLALLRTFSTPFVVTEAQGRAATDLASCGPALLAAAAAATPPPASMRPATGSSGHGALLSRRQRTMNAPARSRTDIGVRRLTNAFFRVQGAPSTWSASASTNSGGIAAPTRAR